MRKGEQKQKREKLWSSKFDEGYYFLLSNRKVDGFLMEESVCSGLRCDSY